MSSKTPSDLSNAIAYSTQMLLKQKCLALNNPNTKWESTFEDGTLPYFCPSGLKDKCDYGHCRVINKDECEKNSVYPYDSDGKATTQTNPKPYLEYRTDPSDPTNNKCYLGNFMLRGWCEFPQNRNPSQSGEPFCYNDPSTGNVNEGCTTPATNVPQDGNCHINKGYCESKGMNWDSNSNTCYLTSGQKFLEALFGTTIVQGVFGGGCLDKLSDRRFKEKIVKIADNYGGKDINLYIFLYKPEVLKKHPEYKDLQLGFMADEIEKVYPEIIKEKEGIKYISISKEKSSKFKRITNTIANSHIILRAYLLRYVLKRK